MTKPIKLTDLPLLSKWSVISNAEPYMAPEQVMQFLNGDVTNHPNPRFKHGDNITTSALKGKALVDGEEVVVTKSDSMYRLSAPLADYERLFPGSKERLFSTLPLVNQEGVPS